MVTLEIWAMWSPELRMSLQTNLEYGKWRRSMNHHSVALWGCQIIWQQWGWALSLSLSFWCTSGTKLLSFHLGLSCTSAFLEFVKYFNILAKLWWSTLLFLLTIQVSRLIYTNSGLAILALAANAVHKLWKWPRNDRNPTAKVLAYSNGKTLCPHLFWRLQFIFSNNVCSNRQVLVLCHNYGNLLVEYWWPMILVTQILKMLFHALLSQRMTPMLCRLLEGKFLCLIWWLLR